MRFLWNLQNLRKIGKFAKLENSQRRLRGTELNRWFLWNVRKLGKHEIDNFKVAPLASVWLPAKCEAIDMKMFFYYSQYAKIFIFTNSVLHVALFESDIFWNSQMSYFLYRASRGFSLAWLLAFTKLFAWLVSRVVGLFTPRERGQTNYATDKPRERLSKH